MLIIIYISFISLGLPDSLLGAVWSSIYNSMSVPISYAGIISIIIAIGTVISSIFSDKIIKYFGTGIVTAISVLITSIALIGFSVSDHFIMLCICAIPLGLGAGSIDAALNNYVALHYKAKHMNWLHCFWGIGAATGPIIVSFHLINTNSWQSGYLTIGIIQFGLATILFLTLPLWKQAGKVAISQDKNNQASLKMIELLQISGVKQALMSFFCYCAIETTVGLWGSSYLVIVKGIPLETAAKWISLYYLGITIGRFFSGFLSIKLNHQQMLRLGQGLIGSGIVLLLLQFEKIYILLGLFIIGLGCAPIFPSLLHETPKNFGKEYSQSIIGIQMASAYIGTTAVPPLFGIIISYLGYNLFPAYIGILLVVMFLMTEILDKKVVKNK